MSFIAIAVGALAIGWARRKLLASEAPSGGTSHGVVAPTGSGRQIADHSAVRAGEGYGGIERAGIDNIQRKLILAMYSISPNRFFRVKARGWVASLCSGPAVRSNGSVPLP